MNSSVPLLDLKAQFRSIRRQVTAAIMNVVESQQFLLGPEVERFERETADYCGASFAVGVTSGTDALLLALMEAGVGPGDEVVTTSYSFISTVSTIVRLGAKPVFVDIDPESFNMNSSQAAARVNSSTKAVLPVHLFGQCADMGPLLNATHVKGVPLIEDAAQSIGAEWSRTTEDGQDSVLRAGAMGRTGCFSFYPAKNLGAYGDAGMVVTSDSDVAERLRVLRQHGAADEYAFEMIGGNFRMDSIQAAVLSVKLRYMDRWIDDRNEKANLYRELFDESRLSAEEISRPSASADRNVWNQFVVRAERRDDLRSYLAEHGVASKVFYPAPLHLADCLRHLGYALGDFPESERASRESLALPIYPELAKDQVAKVVSTVRDFYRERSGA
jgi:dTDP-4-amino-4,6-dideoxygalactose transaminase